MDPNRKRQIILAATVLVGLPLTFLLWANAWERIHSPASGHIAAGDRAVAAGKYLEAMAAYNHARELTPGDPKLQTAMMRARAYLVAEQPARITAEMVDELRYEANHLLKQDRKNAAVYLTELGVIASRANDPIEADAKLNEAIKRDPNLMLAHLARGLFMLSQKNGTASAAEQFELVLKAKPDHPVALIGLAQVDLSGGKDKEAEERLDRVLQHGEDFTARMLAGNARLHLKKYEQAAQDFQHATEMVSNNPVAWRSLGEALLAANKPAEAERALRQAVQIQQDPSAVLALGFALGRQRKSDQALGVFQSILQQDSNAAPALLGAGNVLEDLGRKSDAIAVYKRITSLEASGPAAQSLAQLKQQAEARVAVLEGRAPQAVTGAGGTPTPPPPPHGHGYEPPGLK